jgi:citrate lyase subunit beta-like protein
MDKTERVRRAVLFTPGDSLRKIEKGAMLGVDSLILDLEDGVAASRKAEARQTIIQALGQVDFGRSERLVRINPFESGAGREELEAILPFRPDGIVIPKVDKPEQVQEVSTFIGAMEQHHGWEPGAIRLLVFIESAWSLINLKEIAGSDPRLDGLILGGEDLASNLGATRTRSNAEIFYARSVIVTYAAAFELQAIDTVFVDLQDIDGLIAEAEQAQRLGFTGKLAVHPGQVEPITAAFTPSDAAIARAHRLVEAFHAHQASGKGVFALDGNMVDMPMLRAANRVLARARRR